MKNETIPFASGNLVIDDVSVSFQQHKGNFGKANTISRENIGHTNTELLVVTPSQPWTHIMQLLAGGVCIGIIGLIATTSFIMTLGAILTVFALFLLFAEIFGGMLGMNISKPIIYKLFGYEVYRVVVQNVFGGNNLEFFIQKQELEKLPKIVNYKIEKVEIKPIDVIQETTTNHTIDDIEKLAALKEKGIITNEEFELKKKKILGI